MSAHVPVLPLGVDPLIAEAKQRARRRRLLAAAALLAAAGAAGFGLMAAGGAGGSGEIPWLPTRPQLGPANPPLAPPCTVSQLRATLALQGAGFGNLVGGISIRNSSSQACSLVGRPQLSFAGATSKWHQTRQGWDGPVDPLRPPLGSLRALAPGKWVWVGIDWAGWCGRGSNSGGDPGKPPTAILLRAPGGGTVVLARDQYGGRPLGSPQCFGGPGYPSHLGATRFTPYIPQGPPSSALPLKVRIVSGGLVSSKGKTLTQPSFVAHPGSWLSYTVVLTNVSRKPFRFGKTCPTYTEGFGVSQLQAYVLNCRPVGSIAPGQSVRFAMRIRVPHLALSAPAFGWTLAPHTYNAPGALAVVQLR